jgi:hypothetical protein
MWVRIPFWLQYKLTMSNINKKKDKLKNKIAELQNELTESLTKKTSTTKEIDVAGHQRKIQELQKQLQSM